MVFQYVQRLVYVVLLQYKVIYIVRTYAPFTFGLRCVYGARRLPVTPFPYGLRAEVATAVRYRTDLRASQPLPFCLKKDIQL